MPGVTEAKSQTEHCIRSARTAQRVSSAEGTKKIRSRQHHLHTITQVTKVIKKNCITCMRRTMRENESKRKTIYPTSHGLRHHESGQKSEKIKKV